MERMAASTTNNDQTLVDNDLDAPSTDLDNDLEMMAKLKFTMNKLKRLQMMLVHGNKKVEIISHQDSTLKLKLTRTDQYGTAVNLKKMDPLNELPHTPVCSASSSADKVDSNLEDVDSNLEDVDSNLEDLNSAEPLNTQIVESKNLPNSQGGSVVLGPSLDQLELNPKKQHKTKNTSTRPRNLGKMREFTVVTENSGYYTCLGDFDPNEDRDVCYRKQNVELPSWRIKSFSDDFTMDAADITTETAETIEQTKYHSKCEKSEQQIKRWDLQRTRELGQIDYLKEGRYKKSLQNLSNENTEQDMRSLLPNPDGIDVVQVTDNIPVSAFGCNLHVKKNAGSYKFHRSKWYNDGTGTPEEFTGL